MILARAVVPGIRGSVTGISGLIDAADTASAVGTQLAAIVLVALLVALTAMFAQSSAPIALRLLTIALAGLGGLSLMGAMTLSRPPELFLLVLSGSFSLLAVLLALDALRRPRVGLAAWLPLSAGLASLLRVTGILLAERAREQALDVASIVSAYQQARWFSTLSMGLVMLGTLAGLLFLARRFLVRTLVAVLSATVLAGLASLAATRTPGVDESSFMVIARRSMQQLELRPETHLPPGLAHFLVAFGLATAIAVLVLRLSLRARSFPLAPPVLAAMALALLARDAADIPLFGLALAVSALTLAVVARTLEHGGDDAAGLPLPQSLLGRLSPSKRSRTAVPAPPNQLAPPS